MLYRQTFSKGLATSKLEEVGAAPNRRGTTVTFTPDPEIFGADAAFDPARLYKLARSKAYLFAGVEIRWRCDPSLASRRRPRNRRLPVRQRPRRPSRRAVRRPAHASPTSPSSASRTSPTTRAAPNGRSPGRSIQRRQRILLLQHHPDPRRRHPRSGPPRRADQGHPRVRRARRQQARQGHHRRRRLQRRRADALASSSATRISRARPRTA